MSVLRVGIAGLGTVGAGVVDVLQRHRDLLAARCRRPIEIVAVNARDRDRDRGVDLAGYRWVDDARDLAGDPEVDVVAEMIGGEDGIALELAEKALASGQHLVTANKALLAVHGTKLAQAADSSGVHVGFEAAVAGGIPIIKALREGLAGNAITRLYGILNGTSNYIMTAMRDHGSPFDEVLAEAQRLGYAENDALILLIVMSVGNVFLQFPVGMIADRYDRRVLLIVFALLMVVCTAIFPLALGDPYVLWPLLFFWGGIMGGMYTCGLALVGQRFNRDELAAANATFIFVYEFGHLVGPPIAGVAILLWYPHGLIVLSVVGGLLFAIIATIRHLTHKGQDNA